MEGWSEGLDGRRRRKQTSGSATSPPFPPASPSLTTEALYVGLRKGRNRHLHPSRSQQSSPSISLPPFLSSAMSSLEEMCGGRGEKGYGRDAGRRKLSLPIPCPHKEKEERERGQGQGWGRPLFSSFSFLPLALAFFFSVSAAKG